MGRKSAGLVGIVATVLALGLGASVEAGATQDRQTGLHVVAEDQGPTVITPTTPGATTDEDQGPTAPGI